MKANRTAVLGIPFDANSSLLRGPALAPGRIRQALHSGSSNYSTELGVDINAANSWVDAGDVRFGSGDPFEAIETAVSTLLEQGARMICLGGDHSITYPILRAYGRHYSQLSILHLDAHPDLYDELEGNRYSHASPFARIMEEGLAARLVQIGIRTLNAHQRTQAERFGVEIMEMRHWQPERLPAFDGPLYLSLDLDALDPAFAPGVSHHEPGGFTTRQVLDILHRLPSTLVGADIVELNPHRDLIDATATLAAKLLKELLGLFQASSQ